MFLANQDFIDLVLPEPVEGYDANTQLLGDTDILGEDGKPLFDGQVFPYYYTDGTNEKARTFVLVDDRVPKVDDNGIFKYVKIFVYAFTHKSFVKLTSKEKLIFKSKKYKGVCRTDVLATVIDNILNKSTVFGLKELKLDSVDIFKPPTNGNEYYGRVLTYTAKCENVDGDDCGD